MRVNLSEIARALPVRSVEFGEVFYGPGGECGPRVQWGYQIVLLLRGEAAITVEGNRFALPAGHASLQRPGLTEHFQFARRTETHHTWCTFECSEPSLPTRLEGLPNVIPITPALESLVRLGIGLGLRDNPYTNALRETLARGSILEFLRAAHGEDELLLRLPRAVVLAMQHIHHCYTSPIGLSEIADAAHITGPHLIRLFRKHLATTPVAYLWDVRAMRAVQLIRETGLRVCEIADRTGFQTSAHLSRTIREREGLSPSQLRRRLWRRTPSKS